MSAAEARFAEPGSRWSFDAMLAWCEDNNMRACFREMERWYYVEQVSLPGGNSFEIKTLDGSDATAARKLIRGELKDYGNWPEQRMQRYRSWLRSCIRRGMTPERYAKHFQEAML